MLSLDIKTESELENLIIEGIYKGVIDATLNSHKKEFIVINSIGRDLRLTQTLLLLEIANTIKNQSLAIRGELIKKKDDMLEVEKTEKVKLDQFETKMIDVKKKFKDAQSQSKDRMDFAGQNLSSWIGDEGFSFNR